jgi:hypothetical protein
MISYRLHWRNIAITLIEGDHGSMSEIACFRQLNLGKGTLVQLQTRADLPDMDLPQLGGGGKL